MCGRRCGWGSGWCCCPRVPGGWRVSGGSTSRSHGVSRTRRWRICRWRSPTTCARRSAAMAADTTDTAQAVDSVDGATEAAENLGTVEAGLDALETTAGQETSRLVRVLRAGL